jgi:flagellar biosynthesis/type III secretory pathway M-ring protein FliF/YscJ
VNNLNFYITTFSLIIIFIVVVLLIITLYKLLTELLLKERKKPKKSLPPEFIEEILKETAKAAPVEKKKIDYRSKVKEIAKADPLRVALIVKKWLYKR